MGIFGALDEKLCLGRMKNQLIFDMEELENGNISFLSNVYFAFALKDRQLIAKAGRIIGQSMARMTGRQLVRLEEEFRGRTSMEWFADWKKVDLSRLKDKFEEEAHYDWVLRLGTFHPNGYFRQACIEALRGREGALPFLFLRLNDWVMEVRQTAEGCCVTGLENCTAKDLFYALPFLDKAVRGGRRSEGSFTRITVRVSELLRECLTAIPPRQIKYRELPVRKALYRSLFTGADAKEADWRGMAWQLLSQEPDSSCKRFLFSKILEKYRPGEKETEQYLQDKSAVVRRMAVEYRYALTGGAWEGLEKLLLDSCRAVRENAAFILNRRAQIDVRRFYAEALLETAHREQAIAGLGENGTEEDAGLILPFVDSDERRVAAAAVKALGKILGPKGEAVYWKCLFDHRRAVSRAAFTAAQTSRVRFGADVLYKEAWKHSEDGDPVRPYLIRLLLEENSWSRLPYLLMLYQEKDPGLRRMIRRKAGVRNIYGRISGEQEEEIKRILADESWGIPQDLKKGILFDLKFVTR